MKVAQLFAAIALLASPVSAQPPPAGSIGAFVAPSILCDTRAQLRSIVEAFEENAEAGAARFVELFTQLNHRREPSCAVTAVVATTLESSQLGILSLGGAELYGWIIHVQNGAGSGFFLYLEEPAEALKNTI